MVSYGLDGRERWRLPLGPFRNYKGMGASPIVAGRSIVLVCDQDVGSYLLAVDKETGRIRWRTERPEIPGNGHSTPVVYEDAGATMLAVLGGSRLTGYRADTGERVWWVGGLSIQPKSSPIVGRDPEGRTLLYILAPGAEDGPSPKIPPFSEQRATLDKNGDGKVAGAEMGNFIQADADGDGVLSEREYDAFMASGSVASALMAIRPAGRGDLTATGPVWTYRKSLPLVPTPLLYQGVLYLLKEGGIVTALDPATGEVFARMRLTGALDNYFSSPIAADGNLYMVSQAGHVAVVKAGRQPELLAVNDLDDECFATPSVAPGRLYIRSRTALYCFTRGGP
jgi:outer membrane protein assembly factor BamB